MGERQAERWEEGSRRKACSGRLRAGFAQGTGSWESSGTLAPEDNQCVGP